MNVDALRCILRKRLFVDQYMINTTATYQHAALDETQPCIFLTRACGMQGFGQTRAMAARATRSASRKAR